MVVHFLMSGTLLLEQAFVSLAGRNLHRYMSNYLHISLHQNIRNCSPPSTADSRPGTSRTQLKRWKPAPYVASEKKRLQHFLVLHLHGHLFFPNVILMALFGTVYAKWRPEWDLATTVVFMNSSINPILYCWRLRELRAAVMKIGNKMLHKQRDEDIVTSTYKG